MLVTLLEFGANSLQGVRRFHTKINFRLTCINQLDYIVFAVQLSQIIQADKYNYMKCIDIIELHIVCSISLEYKTIINIQMAIITDFDLTFIFIDTATLQQGHVRLRYLYICKI